MANPTTKSSSSSTPPTSTQLTPPRVRLPQGTYEGRVVAAGQNVVEAAGLGLGVGAGGASSSGQQKPKLAQQMALPKALDAFLGIPYAQTTAGANRFRAPVPLAIAGGEGSRVIPATQLGQRCPGASPNPFVPEGENCLNLNVYRPSNPAAEPQKHEKLAPLPVVVYVHGGGFNNGLGAERDMASFVGYADVDLIGVSFNYRVGALGFLGWLGGDDPEDAPLNVGLRDQQALFGWVQANIGYFGGDVNNITVMGLSAGAHSIGHHLLYYPPGQAPFHKAILESGGPTARAIWYPDHPRPKAQLRQFLAEAGVFAAGVPCERDVVAHLRDLPLAQLVAASRRVWNAYQANVCWPFQPVVDGQIVRRRPLQTWRAGFSPQIPVLTGFGSNEGTIFVPADCARADTDAHFRAFFAELVPGLTTADLDKLAHLYPDPVSDPTHSPYVLPEGAFPPGVTGRQWARLEAAYAHYAYICPVLQTAHYLADAAAAAAASAVYVYEFAAHALPWDAANHGDNQTIVAHSMAVLRGHPGLTAVSDAMHGAWVRFAASPAGDPNGTSGDGGAGPGGVRWQPFVSPFGKQNAGASESAATQTTRAGAVLVFGQGNDERVPPAQRKGGPDPHPGTPAALRSLSEYELAQCRFWWERAALSQGYGRRDDDGTDAAAASPAVRTRAGDIASRL